MERRAVLQTGLSAGLAATAGCVLFDLEGKVGVNKKLEIDNTLDRRVTLHIVVHREYFDQPDEKTFDQNVTVPAADEKTLKILGDHQHDITVAGLGNELRFGARPICNKARTRLIIESDESFRTDIEDCE